MIAIRRLSAAAIVLLALCAPSDSMILRGGMGAASSSFTPTWATAKLCCGGLMNNIQVSNSDGTIVGSANTYGAYLFKPTGTCAGADNGGWGSDYSAPCWEQLFTATSASLTLTQVNALLQGVLEITSCNNNTSDAYAWFNKNLWVTTNLKSAASSRSWANTGLATTINGNQGINAGTGPTLACDPANPNIIYAANTSALNVSSKGLSGGSASFSTVSGVGTIGAIPSIIYFDPTSSTQSCTQFSGSPTCTSHFWVFTDGTGVYETYNGGSSFTLTSSGPTTASHAPCGEGGYCFRIKADQFGTLWAAIGDTKLYKYVPNGTAGGGTWSSSSPGIYNSQVAEFAIDPTSGSAATLRIAAANADGNISLSTNGAGSWTSHATTMAISSSSPQPGWVANANQYSSGVLTLAIQDLTFDASGNLWTVTGIGAFEILSANVSVSGTWVSNNLGMEQLVANHVASCSGNAPVVAVWDRGVFTMQNPDVFPGDYYPDYNVSHSYGIINAGWAVDCAPSNTNFFTAWVNQDNTVPASSSDGGITWTAWPGVGSATTNLGGAIAASTTSNWLWIPAEINAGASQVWYTTNAATGWTQSSISGETTPYTNGLGYGFPIAADSVTANAFCLIDNANNIFSSTNSGATLTKVSSAAISGVKYNDALKAVPGQAGVFYYSGGNAGGNTTTYNLYKITKTTNECDTVAKVSSTISDIYGFGYGAPVPGGNGFPTIYFYGQVSGVTGLYEIDNGGSTASLISAPSAAQTWPNNSLDFVKDVSGDMSVYGRIYVGFNGSGFAYIDTQNACPWVNFTSAFKPTSSLTGTVTLQAQQSGKVPVTSVSFYVDGTLIGTQTSGSGTPTTYSQSWNTGSVATGSHALQVTATGNGCNPTASTNYANFSIPITTH